MNCPLCGAANQSTEFCASCGQRIGGVTLPEQSATPPTITRSTGARAEAAGAYLKLEPSEQAVFHAASRLFAAYVASGQVTDATEAELMKRAVSRSIQLALFVERSVQSDGEDW